MATLMCAMMRGSGEGNGVGAHAGWRGVLALVCAAWVGACREPPGTSLYITTEFEPTLLITQVRVGGSVDGGLPFGPQVLPEHPERLLHSGETLRILLEEAPNGALATVYVEGLSNKGMVARGEGIAQIRDGHEVDLAIRLEPASLPPPPPTDGGFCVGCEGCCIQGRCTPSTFNTCGTGGISCVTCDPARTDTCDARGVCVCGTGPACSELSADRCVGGQCMCGGGPACAPGQECVDGTCRCTPNSCSGCCTANNVCAPGNTKEQCGRGGAACRKCNKNCNPDRTCS